MQEKALIRLYEPRDIASVRQISCDTADRGGPVESFFSDREVIADLLISYYAGYEPDAFWVAEYDGKVVGYLSGGFSSLKYIRAMAFWIVPLAAIKAILRGALFRAETWKIANYMFATWMHGGFSRAKTLLKYYPAHMHINIKPDFRGMHIGDLLVGRFLEQAKKRGTKGIHLSLIEDNAAARKFFEKAGFKEIGRYPVFYPAAKDMSLNHTLIYGKKLDEA